MDTIRRLINFIRPKFISPKLDKFRSAKSVNFEEEYFDRLLLPESKIEEEKRNAGE